MASANSIKGRSLEKAVQFIQETILTSDPKLKGTQFTIETNKRDTSSGVLHEIDVLVKTHIGSDYEATWLFECKNWEKPVDKNEIIVFAEKVEALRASRGFFVAKSLSKEAEAQIALKPRLSFVRCNEDFFSPLNTAQILHSATDVLPTNIQMKERDVACSQKPQVILNHENLICRLNGRPIPFMSFIDSQIHQLAAEDRQKNPFRYRFEGTHWGGEPYQIDFAKGELLIEGMDIEHIVLPFFFFVTTQKRRIVSKFEIEGQGRAYFFEPIEDFEDGKPLEIQMVQRL